MVAWGFGGMGVPFPKQAKSSEGQVGAQEHCWALLSLRRPWETKCQSKPLPTQPGPASPDGEWRGTHLVAEINSHDPVLSACGYLGHLDCRSSPLRACPAPTLPSLVFSVLWTCCPENTEGGKPEIPLPLAFLRTLDFPASAFALVMPSA